MYVEAVAPEITTPSFNHCIAYPGDALAVNVTGWQEFVAEALTLIAAVFNVITTGEELNVFPQSEVLNV